VKKREVLIFNFFNRVWIRARTSNREKPQGCVTEEDIFA
jgi:hypothetical protein